MPNPAWHFHQQQRGAVRQDPTVDEFFRGRKLAESLVREAVQNSLDARAPQSTQVTVRFRFGRAHVHAGAEESRWFSGLTEHVDSLARHRGQVTGKVVDYLVVEDKGTRGLNGDPSQDKDVNITNEPKNDFYYFWRNVGRSRKSASDRGRWGLGKSVFSSASRARCFFGLTTRSDDSRTLLMGQAALELHTINNIEYHPHGFFGSLDGGLTLPIESSELVREFRSLFGIQEDPAPGLCIVVPFFRTEDLDPQQIMSAVIENYFFPIVMGELEVEVTPSSGSPWIISAETLEEISSQPGLFDSRTRFAKDRMGLLRLGAWFRQNRDASSRDIDLTKTAAPSWDHAIAGLDIPAMRDEFEKGHPTAIRVNLKLEDARLGVVTSQASFFHLVIQQDVRLTVGQGYLLRRGISVSNRNPLASRRARGFLVAEDVLISSLLGDAENPAHTEWSRRSERLNVNWKNGPGIIDFVGDALSEILKALSGAQVGRDPSFLRDVFSLPLDEVAPDTDEEPQSPPSPEINPRAKPIPYKIGKWRDGFSIRGVEGLTQPQTRFRVFVAYDVRRGNPFVQFSPHDFDLTGREITRATGGVQVESVSPNRLDFLVLEPGFSLQLMGFGHSRDLKIRVQNLKRDGTAES